MIIAEVPCCRVEANKKIKTVLLLASTVGLPALYNMDTLLPCVENSRNSILSMFAELSQKITLLEYLVSGMHRSAGTKVSPDPIHALHPLLSRVTAK